MLEDVSAKTIVVLGAGPAGLTAAVELLALGYRVRILERQTYVGGISATIDHHNNKMDLGGHRFFSKSKRVLEWWLSFLPLSLSDPNLQNGLKLFYQGQSLNLDSIIKTKTFLVEDKDDIMLIRSRKSRIYFAGKFYAYPLRLSLSMLFNIGFFNSIKIIFSYVTSKIFPVTPEVTLEDFFINRFGRSLYKMFFKSYTEKVWGRSCARIPATWGHQRIKGLSLLKFLLHGLARVPLFRSLVNQKKVETSLIEYFLYPKYGPGHLWRKVADKVEGSGGKIEYGITLKSIEVDSLSGKQEVAFYSAGQSAGETVKCDAIISTIAVDELLELLGSSVPSNVLQMSKGLKFRSLITVALLFSSTDFPELTDNWLYIHSSDIKIGRIQIFNNWSPALVDKPDTVWIGAELFCDTDEDTWSSSDGSLVNLCMDGLRRLGLVGADVKLRDSKVVRVPKAYPSYVDGYESFTSIVEYLNTLPNLFTIGRNGMHRYNNQDHSMLAAFEAVRLIHSGETDRSALWSINTEMDYHEEK